MSERRSAQPDSGNSLTGEDMMLRDRDSVIFRTTGKFNRSTVLMGLMFAVGLGWVVWESTQIREIQPSDESVRVSSNCRRAHADPNLRVRCQSLTGRTPHPRI